MFQEVEINGSLNEFLKEKFSSLKAEGNSILSFTAPEDEYNSLRYGVGVRLITDPAILLLTGSDTLDFIQRVSTNDVRNLKAFHTVKTIFLNDKGKFIDSTLLMRFDTHFIILGSAGNGNKLQSWINKFIITEDIKVEPAASKFTLLEFNGRQVNSYITMLAGSQAENIAEGIIIKAESEGIPLHLFRRDYGCGNSFYILIEKDFTRAFIDHILETKSCFDLSFAGEEAYNLFRIENGVPAFPNEINDNINPHENGLIGEVSFTKGCYIGQEVVARLETYDKVQRKLSAFMLEKSPEMKLPSTLYNSKGEEAGEVTSYARGNNGGVALGFIRKKFSSPDEEYFTFDKSGMKISIQPKE